MSERVRVLIVDDSPFYRKRIRCALRESARIEVVGEAGNGEEALQLTRTLAPDLVTMDVAMPVMDGIEAVARIMKEHPTPVIMFSALTREGARATLDALDAGAVDFLPKVNAREQQGSAAAILRERVLEVVANAYPNGRAGANHPLPEASSRHHRHAPASARLLVIGASTGGPVAVQKLLAELPADLPVPVLVGIHMPGSFTPTYAERLNSLSALKVREAQDGSLLLPGEVLVAPGGLATHVVSKGHQLAVAVDHGSEADLYHPSVDELFESTARTVGADGLGIVLTGMGADGADGAAALKRAGGRIWAQDKRSSVVYGMPRAVTEAGLAERVLSLQQIVPSLLEEL